MKKAFGGLFVILLVAFSYTDSTAQKFGYINSTQLLIEHPEIKVADSQLETFQNQLITKGQQMVKDLETKYNTYIVKANSGELSQVQMQQKEGEFEVEQQEIAKFEQEVQMEIAKKREELYQPILDNVKSIIEEIGKEEGYTMIFDSTSGAILSASDNDNLLSQVKQKLGI